LAAITHNEEARPELTLGNLSPIFPADRAGCLIEAPFANRVRGRPQSGFASPPQAITEIFKLF
jgi:hypothetical protein